MTRTALLAAAVLIAACAKAKDSAPTVQTVPVERRDIVIDVQATGTVEPINVVEVKSKASGQIVQMPVETGSRVKPGDLLVQVDTRDVQNQYNQSREDVRAAETKLQISEAQKKRVDDLFAQKIITAQEHEAAALDYANAQASVVRARTNLDLALQRLEDATVRAPVGGTVIEKTVSLGQVITSATGAFGGGTTLLKMADLNQVRVRALVNETDIGQVQPGQQSTVTVDAYPDRPFVGSVEKIEPQAVVQQNVTMFPVLVSLENREGLLRPGMNGEVSVLVERRANVLAIPNDAIRNPREAMAAAQVLGLNPDTVRRQLEAQRSAMMGAPGGAPGDAPVGVPVAPGAGATRGTSRGSVDAAALRGEPEQAQFQLPEVTDQECAAVRTAFARNPDAQRRLDQLREQMRAENADRRALVGQMREVYASAGVDAGVARACEARVARRASRVAEAGRGTASESRGPNGGAAPLGTPATRDARRATREGVTAVPTGGATRVRSRPGLVFVAEGLSFAPRMVRLGASNWDYTEVIGGLEEGERVALLAAASLQFQRQQQNERMRERFGGMPGMQRQGQGGQGGAGGAAGGAGGAGAPGGGRRTP